MLEYFSVVHYETKSSLQLQWCKNILKLSTGKEEKNKDNLWVRVEELWVGFPLSSSSLLI